jgi:hypothetical protein
MPAQEAECDVAQNAHGQDDSAISNHPGKTMEDKY